MSLRKAVWGFLFVFLLAMGTEAAVTLHYPAKQKIGQPFLAFISSDVAFEKASIAWLGKDTPLEVIKYNDGYRAHALLGTDANRIGEGTYPIEFRVSKDGVSFERKIFRIEMDMPKFRENWLRVPPKMVNPPKSEMARIEAEAALTGEARATMTTQKMWQMRAILPLDSSLHETSSYGYRRVYNGTPRGRHSGVDLRAPRGTPIRSVFSGKVLLAGNHYFAGNSVYIDSGNGVISAYYHLNSISVNDGDAVSAGDIIGTAGATGRVTGPHLHLSVFLSGQSVDPMGLLDPKFVDKANNLIVETLSKDD